MVDAFSRHAIRVSVAQICQIIGWTSIQSSPLEILTDILQEYISGLAKIASNYALLYGQCEPNLNHVALAFKDMGISINELEEYVTYVETNTALEIPRYPIPKESHLNHLKPGSREVVTRPVHIHEHLPPMHPHLEDQDYLISKSPLTVEISPSESLSPLSSPKNIFKKPGDPISNDMRRGRQILEDEVRPLREISSVMMTTSGFLSPAREGKLPEARTQPIEFNRNSLSPEGPSTVDESIDKCEKKKKMKPVDVPKKIDKENKMKEDQPSEQKESEEESKGKKLVNNKETSKLKALKTGALKVPQKPPSPTPQKKTKVQLSPTTSQINSNIKHNRVKSPKNDKQPISPLLKEVIPVPIKETSLDDVKLPSEPDRHKLNIFKKISKVKEEYDDPKPVTLEQRENNLSSLDIFFVPQSKKNLNNSNMKDNDEDLEAQIDVENTSPPMKYVFPVPPEIEKIPDLPKTTEPKKKKKDKQKEKRDIEIDKEHNSPKSKYHLEDNTGKAKLPPVPDIILPEEEAPTHHFPFFQNSVPAAPSLIPPWNHPLIPHNIYIPTMPSINIPNSSSQHLSMKNQDAPLPAVQQTTISSSSSSSANPALPTTASLTTFPNKENNLIFVKKKERKRDKKLKEKIKKKKDKKDKNKIKDKSERKKLKLEKKERAKLKLKKEKKEKKKEKEGLVNRIEPGHIAEDILNTLQPWASDSGHPKKIKTEEKEDSANPVPKITFKLGPASPKETVEPSHRKIVIKPIVKKEEDNFDTNSSINVDLSKQSNSSKIKTNKGGKLNHHSKNEVFEKPTTFPFPPVVTPKPEMFPVIPKWEADPNKVWICPACSRPDDGSPMIACDMCDLWFHWTCVGIQEAIESDWYCNICTAKREEGPSEKKKKHRKKKS